MSTPSMSWPSLQDLKDYLRIQTTAEDDALNEILSGAKGAILGYVNRAVDATEMVMEDPAATENVYSAVRKLYVTDYPLSLDTPAPVITDQAGTVVDATTYRWFPLIGMVRANRGIYFANGPYEITATVGLVFVSDFTERIQPILRRAVLDLASVFYQQRDANATQEGEAGVNVSFGVQHIPPRICALIENLRRSSQRVGRRIS